MTFCKVVHAFYCWLKIFLYECYVSSVNDVPLGILIHHQESLGESLQLRRDIVLIFVVCGKLDWKGKIISWFGICCYGVLKVKLAMEWLSRYWRCQLVGEEGRRDWKDHWKDHKNERCWKRCIGLRPVIRLLLVVTSNVHVGR